MAKQHWSEELRQAVRDSGSSGYALSLAVFGSAKRQPQIDRWLRGGGITLDNAELIACHLGFELVRQKSKNSSKSAN